MPPDRTLLRSLAVALGGDVVELDDVRRTELAHDAYQPGRSLVRLAGRATVDGSTRTVSIIEKVTEGPDEAPPFIRDGARRELLAYRSGLLDDLPPGFAAPRAFATLEDANGRITLHLEDVVDERPGAWSPEEYATAAASLGRLSVRGLTSPVAFAPWMLQRWSERHGQPHAIASADERMRRQAEHPAVRARFGDVAGRAAGMLAAQAALRSALDRLPQTLCHHDAVRANLFLRERAGATETVAIDWETLGPGPVAADICSLVFSSVRRGDMRAAFLPSVVPAVLDAYARELDAAGFRLAAGLTEHAFLAAVSLRWSLLRDVLDGLTDPSYPVFRGRALHESRDGALDELLGLTDFLLDAWERVASTLAS